MRRLFWISCAFLLAGYMFLGKGFAYVGAYPMFVSEVVLLLGVLATSELLWRERFRPLRLLWRLEILLLLGFVAWQAVRTAPYIAQYGVQSLRDAMLWGYSAFALCVYLLDDGRWPKTLVRIYGKILPLFLLWLPAAFILTKLYPLAFRFPGSPVPLLWLKSGDVGVHLAGIGAFIMLWPVERGKPVRPSLLWALWLLWALGWAGFGATNRAAMFSAVFGLSIVPILRPRVAWYRPVLAIAFVLGALYMTGFRLELTETNELSYARLRDNVTSIFATVGATLRSAPDARPTEDAAIPATSDDLPPGKGPPAQTSSPAVSGIEVAGPYEDQQRPRGAEEGPQGALEATVAWRLRWWKKILGYTFGGSFLWLGKGYGINLADDDGFQVKEDHSLRSPHNIFMTVLARSGVPGLILWMAMLLAIGWALLSAYRGRTVRADAVGASRCLWLLAYGGAFLFNASFDVFLEGPMGGVWFWCLVGLAFALTGDRLDDEG